METDRIVRLGLLYDFYGSLLTEKQRAAIERYYFHDLSLAEIAGEEGSSRQAVHDLLQRSEETLEQYESKMALIEKYHVSQKNISEAFAIIGRIKNAGRVPEIRDALEQLERILKLLQED